jgi:opine dehydrogenase
MEYGHYGVTGETMYEVYSTFTSHRSWRPGLSLDDFAAKTAFGEDLLHGFVFISSLGKQFNIPTPAIDTMVNLAEIVLERDFWNEGTTAKTLGLDKLSEEQIVEYAMSG